jgi:oligopeptide transport system substrate-binding protein
VLLALGLAMLCLAGSGCVVREKPADLRIVNGKEPESLDPAIMTGQPDERVTLAIFEGLTRFNAVDGQAEPGLSDHWTISDDKKVYTFHIRTNASWSTGQPITSQDFLWSWFRVLEPATGSDYVGNLFYIRGAEDYYLGKTKNRAGVGIKALNPETLRVELLNPTPFFLELCAFPTQAIVPRWIIEKYGDKWLKIRPLPASGAYQLITWRLNDKIRLKKNPLYWDAANTRSDIIDLFPVNAPNTAINLFITGEADIVWDKDVVPSELLDVLRDKPYFHTFDYLGSYFYRYNVTRKPFDDVRVRKALALVIDKKRIVEKITRGGERPGDFYVPIMPNYTSPKGLGYDPELGRKLLAEAGYPGGKGFPRFEYLFNTSRDHEKIAVELQDMWKRELGIQAELRSVEWKVYLNAQSTLNYDLSRSSWIADYSDPNTFLDMFMSNNGNNRTGWKSERYDGLIRKANATADVKQRAKILAQAEAMLIREEVPIVPLYLYVGMNFWDPAKITGVWNNSRDEHPPRTIARKR